MTMQWAEIHFMLNTSTMFLIYTRIALGDMQYSARSSLAVCQWNEIVDRGFTSITNSRNPRTPRSKGKKNYKPKTFKFRNNIWNHYLKSVFGKRNRRN